MHRIVWWLCACTLALGCGRSELGDPNDDDGSVPIDLPIVDRPDVPDTGDVPDVPPVTCGGVTCAPAQACCSGRCTFLGGDNNNCGACGLSCNGGLVCVDGTCRAPTMCPGGCPGGSTCCPDGRCANTSTDATNCGGCGNVCGAGQICVAGACRAGGCFPACTAGQACCAAGCIDVQSDPSNCGACGFACPPDRVCRAGTCQVIPAGCGGGPPCGDGTTCCAGRCVDTSLSSTNCGGCGVTCPRGQFCSSGACRSGGGCGGGCGMGLTCCGDVCLDALSSPTNCGGCGIRCRADQTCVMGACRSVMGCGLGPSCAPGQACCGEACTDVLGDVLNCGGCGVTCRRGQTCAGGRCVGDFCGDGPACTGGATCCGTVCANVQSDVSNCGGCGLVCAPGQQCVTGVCRFVMGCGMGPSCATGTLCCGARCANPATDNSNCGACGRVCRTGESCRSGTCVATGCGTGPLCGPGTGCCDGMRCIDTLSDTANCGACGARCGRGQRCAMGVCTDPMPGCNDGPACTMGQTCCGDGCHDTTADVANCGMCGRPCPTPPNTVAVCRGGTCGMGACVPGFANCNGNPGDGCEANTAIDTNNCGACGTVCMAGTACRAGVCTRPSDGSEGAFNPVVNPTFLSPGVHNFTTINIPAGVVVFLAGGGSESGTLDLRATGDVTIAGTLDVSGGPGSQSTITSRSTQQGRAGAGGFTGDPRTATPGPACQWVGGVSGGNGRGLIGTTGTCRVGSNTTCITDGMTQLIMASPPAQFGGGAGVFSGYRAYGAGGGGFAGGAPGALGAAYMGEQDCTGTTGGGGATAGRGGSAGAGLAVYNGRDGALGQTQCAGVRPGVPASWVGGGGGGSIGAAAAGDLAAATTFYPGSGGGGGSADYLNRPAFGGTSGGGGGGGALRVWSETTITVSGRVLANGGDGGDAYIGTNMAAGCDPQPGAAGGGGSGGLVFLRAPTLTVTATGRVSAVGGAGGAGSLYATGGAGGTGGLGRIRLSANTATCRLNGTLNPPTVTGCTPTPGAGTAGRAYVATYPN